MGRFFEEREHAAEARFAHDEELRFLAHRRGIHALGAWASDGLALDVDAAAAYRDKLLDAFVAGTPESRIVAQVQTDLERAGKPALSTLATSVLARAAADASAALHGQIKLDAKGARSPGAAYRDHALSASLGWRA